MPFFDWSKMPLKEKSPGMSGKVVTGEKMQLAFVKLAYGVETNHSHMNEQIGYILSGEVELTIGSEKKACIKGDAYLVPSNVRHGFKVLSKEGVEYIEIFSPPKQENQEWYEYDVVRRKEQ